MIIVQSFFGFGLAMQEHLANHIIEIYRKHARAWVQARGDVLYEKVWLDRFLALVPQHATILDLGCAAGTTIANYFIEQGHFITGVDRSEVMIAMAQQRFPSQIWINADMRDLNLQKPFNGIVAWDSFFHLTRADQAKMFECFAQHASCGTVLMFSSGPENGEAIGDMFGDALYHASLSPEEYTILLHRYGFRVIDMVAEDPACTGHTVWLAQKT